MIAANQIVTAILRDLTDRRGLRQAWESIDDDVRVEIESAWRNIAKEAFVPFIDETTAERLLLKEYEKRIAILEKEIEAVKPVVRAAREVVLDHRELKNVFDVLDNKSRRDLAELVEALSRVRLWKVDR